jgi:hypothetical protein
VLCEEEGEVKIESVKGGEGIQNGTSLWMKNSTGCVLKGIIEERASFFFIVSISSVDYEEGEEEQTKYKLIFIGSLFFPCLLSFTINSESNILKGIISTKTFSFSSVITQENEGEGKIEKNRIDDTSYDIPVSLLINFPSFHLNSPFFCYFSLPIEESSSSFSFFSFSFR